MGDTLASIADCDWCVSSRFRSWLQLMPLVASGSLAAPLCACHVNVVILWLLRMGTSEPCVATPIRFGIGIGSSVVLRTSLCCVCLGRSLAHPRVHPVRDGLGIRVPSMSYSCRRGPCSEVTGLPRRWVRSSQPQCVIGVLLRSYVLLRGVCCCL